MQPESRKLVEDLRQAAEAVVRLVRNRTYAEYCADEAVRWAVERQFIVIGEALSQLGKRDPDLLRSIAEAPRVIAFRNVLVHDYGQVDDDIVFDAAANRTVALAQAAAALLEAEDA